MTVPARISIVTIGVNDLARSKAFYEALGWEVASEVEGEICWFKTADSYLGLFGFDALAADANLSTGQRAPFGGITLAINVETEEAVTDGLDVAAKAGATILKPAEKLDWGGVSGYFADPDGHPWEICYNPGFPIGDDGRITIG
jgi:uncharacterized protein